jgi:hypothetical protein
MKADREDCRRFYRDLSDEELLSINPEDLVEAGRECYAEELRARGLERGRAARPASDGDTIPEAPASSERSSVPDGPAVESPEFPSPDDSWVLLETFTFPHDAEILRGALDSAGIPSRLENEHTLAMDWLLSNVLGGFRVMVPASLFADSKAMLQAFETEGDGQDTPEPESRSGCDGETP